MAAVAVATLGHAAIGVVAYVSLTGHVHEHATSHHERQVAIERIPPPPRPPQPPASPAPRPRPKARAAPRREAARPPSEAPPAPAQAAKVVAAEPDPAGPLDLTSFDLAMGNARSYAGGQTAGHGTSTSAVDETTAKVGGVPDAPPRAPPARPSQRRMASPAGRDWACAWPESESDSDLRDARVSLSVHVDASGGATRIEAIGSPSDAFADAARHCALRERYRPARDDEGRSTEGSTSPFTVHFVR